MIIPLSKNLTTQLATGELVREGRKFSFKYEVINPRNYTKQHPMDGLIRFVSTASIRTNTSLEFVHGDKIILHGQEKHMRVDNITKRTPKKGQFMYLKKPLETEWTLDLV